MRQGPRSPHSQALDLAELYRRERAYVRACLRSCGVSVAALDDATQDVFVVVHRRLRDYDVERGTIRAWLFGIGLRVARAHHRAHGRTCAIADELRAEASVSDPERYVSRLRAAQLVDRILAALPSEQWSVLVMADVEGMTGPEIAQTLKLPLKTVYTRIARARARVRRKAERSAADRWLAGVSAGLDKWLGGRPSLATAAFVSVRMLRVMATISALLVALLAATLLGTNEGESSPAGDRSVASSTPPGGALAEPARVSSADGFPRRFGTCAISGTIRSDAGAPMQGTTVCAWPEPETLTRTTRPEPRCTQAAFGGRYRLDTLRADQRYRITAAAARHQPAQWTGPDGSTTVRLRADQSRPGMDILIRGGGVRVDGLVVDITGGPIEDAGVALVDPRELDWASGWGAHPPAMARTDEAGAFTAWVARGPVQLVAHASGYASARAMTQAPGPSTTLALTPASSIAGVVVDEAGRPVDGARVGLDGWDPRGVRAVQTDARGAFVLTELPPGRYRLEAIAPGHVGQSPSSVRLGIGESMTGVTITVTPAATVVARAVLQRSGKPCPGGSVSLSSPQARAVPRVLDAEGVARFDAVRPGTYRTVVFCEGYASPPAAPLVVGTEDLERTFEVTRGVALRGRVVDVQGNAVAAAQVSGHGTSEGSTPLGFHESTDDEGAFTIEGLNPGAYTLEAHTSDGAGSPPAAVTLTADGHEELLLRFVALGAVEGTVQTPHGDPIAHARVRVGGGGPQDRIAQTDDEGRFRFEGVPVGRTRINASRDDDDPPTPTTLEITAGPPTKVALVLEPRTGVITGTVLSEDADPIADAIVVHGREGPGPAGRGAALLTRLRHAGAPGRGKPPTTTDQEGRFVLTEVPTGQHTVLAFRRGGGDAWAAGVAVDDDLRLELPLPTNLRGTVQAPGGGAPASMRVVLRGDDDGTRLVEEFYDGTGIFRFDDLDPGTYHLRVHAPEGIAEGSTTVGPDDDGDVSLTLLPWLPVEGRFVDLETGEPIPDIFALSGHVDTTMAQFAVDFEHALVADGHPRRSDAGGRFVIDDARPGDLYLLALPAPTLASHYQWSLLVAALQPGTQTLAPIPLVRKRKQEGQAPGDLGLRIDRDDGTRYCQRTPVVGTLPPAGAAAAAGLRPGDTIVAVDGHDVTGNRCHLVSPLLGVPPGREVALTLGDGRRVRLTAR